MKLTPSLNRWLKGRLQPWAKLDSNFSYHKILLNNAKYCICTCRSSSAEIRIALPMQKSALKSAKAMLNFKIICKNDKICTKSHIQIFDCWDLHRQVQICNYKYLTTDTNKFKIGKNIASNRLKLINKKIKLKDLNDKMSAFKVKMKSIFLS